MNTLHVLALWWSSGLITGGSMVLYALHQSPSARETLDLLGPSRVILGTFILALLFGPLTVPACVALGRGH
jgi:hypothetical protein